MNNQMNAQELNRRAEILINFANKGMTPQNVANTIFAGQINNYTNEINHTMTQLNNMAQGRPMNEFYIQVLKQNGLTEQNAQALAKLMGIK